MIRTLLETLIQCRLSQVNDDTDGNCLSIIMATQTLTTDNDNDEADHLLFHDDHYQDRCTGPTRRPPEQTS